MLREVQPVIPSLVTKPRGHHVFILSPFIRQGTEGFQLPACRLPFCDGLQVLVSLFHQRLDSCGPLGTRRPVHFPQHHHLHHPVNPPQPRLVRFRPRRAGEEGEFFQGADEVCEGIGEAGGGGEVREVPAEQSLQPGEGDVVGREEGAILDEAALLGAEAAEDRGEDGGEAAFVIVLLEGGIRVVGEGVEVLQTDVPSDLGVGNGVVDGKPGGGQLDGEGKAAQAADEGAGGGALGVIGDGAELFHEAQGLVGLEFAQGEPAGGLTGPEAGGGQEVEGGPEAREGAALLRREDGEGGGVVQNEEDGALFLQALAQPLAEGGEVDLGIQPLLLREDNGERAAGPGEGGAQVGLVLARNVEPPAGIGPGEGVGVGEGEFRFPNAAEPVDAADDAGAVVMEGASQEKQLVEAAGEVFIVRRDSGLAEGGARHLSSPPLKVFGQLRQHGDEVRPLEGGQPEVRKGLAEGGGDLLAAAELAHHGGGVGQVVRVGHRRCAEDGHLLRDLLLAELVLSEEARHLHKVDRGGPVAEDVLRDLLVDPQPPLPAAPLAGEVGRGKEGEEEAGLRDAVAQARLPVVERADVFFIEKERQLPTAGELPVLGLECLQERGDEAVAVVVAGVGDKEVEAVRIGSHAGK